MKSAHTSRNSLPKGALALVCLALASCLGAALVAGCSPQPANPVQLGPTTSEEPATLQGMAAPGSYDEVYQAIVDALGQQGQMYGVAAGAAVREDSAPMAADNAAASSASTDAGSYSATNVQVAGVDEGDIIATDGASIFMLSGPDIVVIRADGAGTQEVGRITVGNDVPDSGTDDNALYPTELYISGSTLVVLYSTSYLDTTDADAGSADKAYYPYYNYRNVTEAALYDISDPGSPRFLGTFGQDGYYVSSRLQDGILYVISNYALYDASLLAREAPVTYVPALYAGSNQEAMGVADLCILPNSTSTSYSVVTSIDVARGQRIDQKAVLGPSDTVYMSAACLYLAGSVYDRTAAGSYQDGSFTVTTYEESYSTRISKLSLDAGAISVVADTQVPGTVLNQFALDEYEGNLRVATTVSTTRYRVLDDGSGEITDYNSYASDPTTNALFVLDEGLRTIGTIDDLAQGEQVYSVRFDGAVGYVVTFMQVDPLFAIDLSDPENPQVKSELTLPGFSTYLHVFDNGQLLGIGRAADAEGRTGSLKLSLYDTSDPYNVTESEALELDGSYSEALYNHKAALIDRAENLIGFPVDNGYEVYGYSDARGFYLRLSYQPADGYSVSQRGLYAGGYFYICTPGSINVYTLDDLTPVTQVPIEISEASYPIMPLMME